MCGKTSLALSVIGMGVGGYWAIDRFGNLLSGFNGDRSLSHMELQGAISAFCLSPLPSMLMTKMDNEADEVGETYDFKNDGDINEEDYTKDSIYAVLYSIYANVGLSPAPKGKPYQFTFNTWGISDVDWILDESEPQRHGKAAYQGLVEFPAVKTYLQANPNPQLVEIGCGTGAGANHISQLIDGCKYLALDMQQMAVDTCKSLHAANNPRLTCQHVSGGVGGSKGKPAPMPDHSVDIVVISETHIAEDTIGPEEMAIFKEIVRMLKPGGFFVWGNALPTSVWNAAPGVLEGMGFESCDSLNHTKGAVHARLEDEERVDMYMEHIKDQFPVMKLPFFGTRCRHIADRLVKNFYRHPGTALFKRMETGAHSYMHNCYRRPA